MRGFKYGKWISLLILLILAPSVLSQAVCTECEHGSGALVAIAISIGIVIVFLILLADRASALYVTTASGIELPMLKYFLLLTAGWITLAGVDLAIGIVEWLVFPRIAGTVNAVYAGMMWVLIFLTSFWFVAFFYFVFMSILRWTKIK